MQQKGRHEAGGGGGEAGGHVDLDGEVMGRRGEVAVNSPAVHHEGGVAGVVIEGELGCFGCEGRVGGFAAYGFFE